jgi:hypothetical protein
MFGKRKLPGRALDLKVGDVVLPLGGINSATLWERQPDGAWLALTGGFDGLRRVVLRPSDIVFVLDSEQTRA